MLPTVVAFEGPVGVGKTTLGRAVAARLDIGFIDGDDHSAPGPWLRSILQTSRRIAAACADQLETRPAVILAYPLRCTDWLFYKGTFCRQGIGFHCVSLTAQAAHIAGRDRVLTPDELARASQMLAQGYGRRPFSDLVVPTDEAGFDATCGRLARAVAGLLAAPDA